MGQLNDFFLWDEFKPNKQTLKSFLNKLLNFNSTNQLKITYKLTSTIYNLFGVVWSKWKRITLDTCLKLKFWQN